MSIFDKLLDKRGEILEMIKDPRIKDLVTKREFRLSEDFLHREFLNQAADEELTELKLKIGEGFAEMSGKVKKRPLPFAIPFSARFSMHSVDFTHKGKVVNLKVDELKPFDMESLNRKLVEKIPFLSYDNGLVTLDLARIPRLAELFEYHVKGVRPFDFLVLKDLSFCKGEVVGKVGVCF